MNPLRTVIALLLALFIVIPLHVAAQPDESEEEELVIPPEAHEEAIKALEALGPDRGAKTITHTTADIVGVAKGIEAKSQKVEATLQDLSAKVTETEIQIDLSGDILFDFDKWNIRADAEATLGKIGEVMHAYESDEIVVSGHTDSKGSEEYNQQLSEKRAAAVKEWFAENAEIEKDKIEAVGYGESKPKASNTNPDGSDNPQGRQENRRVEILIKKN